MAQKTCNVIPCNLDGETFVFVSYAHENAERVFPVIEMIACEGYQVWYDKGINISSTWTDEIASAIMSCEVFVVFISNESIKSSYVRSEIEFALNKKKKIIPVYLDNMDILPPGLALGLNSTQGVDGLKSPYEIGSQVCKGLAYNKVAKKTADYRAEVSGKINRPPRAPRRGLLAAALFALIAAAGVLAWNTQNSRKTGYSAVMDKDRYLPAEPISLSISGVSPKMLEDGSMIGICAPDAPPGEYMSYEYIRETEGGVVLRAPVETGEYEIRGYTSGNVFTDATTAVRLKFKVEGNAKGAFSMSIGNGRFIPGENIDVSVKGVPKYMLDDGAIIGLYRKDAPHEKFILYEHIGARDKGTIIDAPYEAGEYEIRTYSNDRIFAESTLIARAPFVVQESPKPRTPYRSVDTKDWVDDAM